MLNSGIHAWTPVPFVDGRSYTLREIVDNRIEGSVWSYNEKNKKIVPAKIINGNYYGKIKSPDEFISITCDAIETVNGRACVTCANEHEILTIKGWKKAKDLTINDLFLTKYESKINGTLKSS